MGKGRAPCCDKNKVKRGPWSPQEDLKLITFIQKHGHPNWRSLPKQAGLLRCGKSCRLRWINYLRPDVKRGNFTKEEEDTIMKLHETLGNKWSKIASELPGRTDNEIKNVWNTHLKKKLLLKNTSDQESSCITSHSSSSSSSNTGHHQAETETLIPQKTTDNINEQSSENNLNKDQCSTDQSSPTSPICKLQDDHQQQQLELVASAGSSILYQGGGPDDDNNNNNYNNSKVPNEVVDKPSNSNDLLEIPLEADYVDKPSNSNDLLEIPLEADYDFWSMLDDDNIGVSNDHRLHQHQVHSSDAESMKYWIREIEKDLGLEPQESSSSSDLTIGLLSDDIELWPNVGSSGLI